MHRKKTSTIGAGGVLIHQDHCLLVQMNYSQFKGHWILPGGRVEAGEHPDDAAIREAKEETGLDVTIQGQLAVRHRILQPDLSDVYFVFLLQLVTPHDELPALAWNEDELLEVRFWPIDEALKEKLVRPMTKSFIKMALKQHPGIYKKQPKPEGHHRDDVVFGLPE